MSRAVGPVALLSRRVAETGRPAFAQHRMLAVLALGAWLLARVVPGSATALTDVAIVAMLALSLDVTLRRLGAPVLVQPGVVALSGWLTAWLLARNQSAVVALAIAVTAGAAAVLPLALPRRWADPRALAVCGTAAGVAVAVAMPPLPGYGPPMLLGVALATPTAALTVALLTLLLAERVVRGVDEGELGRWLGVVVADPAYAARSGSEPRVVTAAGLALCGGLAGLAGGALALASLGRASAGGVDPVTVLVWLTAPLLATVFGGGVLALVAGAAVAVGLGEAAGLLGLHPAALAAPVLAALLLRGGAR